MTKPVTSLDWIALWLYLEGYAGALAKHSCYCKGNIGVARFYVYGWAANQGVLNG